MQPFGCLSSLRPKILSDYGKSPWFRGEAELLIKTMTEIEDAILHALVELDSAVKGMAIGKPKPNLLPMFERIDGFVR